MSADTIVPNPFHSQDFNRYSYVRNNPLKYTDPTGHCGSIEDLSFYLISFCFGEIYDEWGLGYDYRDDTFGIFIVITDGTGDDGSGNDPTTPNDDTSDSDVTGGDGRVTSPVSYVPASHTIGARNGNGLIGRDNVNDTAGSLIDVPSVPPLCPCDWVEPPTRSYDVEDFVRDAEDFGYYVFRSLEAFPGGSAGIKVAGILGVIIKSGGKYSDQIFKLARGAIDRANRFLGRGGGAPDPNKLHHIFGRASHDLGGLVNQFGSQEKAFEAIQKATQVAVKNQGLNGVFETTVKVGGETLTVGGRVMDGTVRIGTAFK